MSPALEGRFLTTGPPGSPDDTLFICVVPLTCSGASGHFRALSGRMELQREKKHMDRGGLLDLAPPTTLPHTNTSSGMLWGGLGELSQEKMELFCV